MGVIAKKLKCPKCGAEMREGFMPGSKETRNLHSVWIEGRPERAVFSGGLKTADKEVRAIAAYRCDGCGYLEYYADDLVL
jgi:predicted nucleic-acid-binding Zn-ribbon protein